MSVVNRQGYSDPIDVYTSAVGERVEKYPRDAVLPPVKMERRGRWEYRRNVQTGAWVSHDKYLGRYGCGCCHTNRCDADCPSQEAATYGPLAKDATTGGQQIPVGNLMKQVAAIYGGDAKPEDLTPPTEEEHTA